MGAPSSGFSGRPHFGGSMLDDTLKYGMNLSKVCGAEKGGVIVYQHQSHVLIKGLLFCSARIRVEAC